MQTKPIVKKYIFLIKLSNSIFVVIPELGCRCTMLMGTPAQEGCVMYPSLGQGLQYSCF